MLKNITTGEILLNNLEHANTPKKAAIGLLGKKNIDNNDGVILYDCKAIHTWFMRFSIDVFFLDREKRVVYMVKNMGPWRLSKYIKESQYVIETKTGSISNRIRIHDQLSW